MRASSFPPGPRGLDLLDAGAAAVRFLPSYFQQLAGRYGDVAGVRAGPLRMVLLSSPALAQDLLSTSAEVFEKARSEQRFTRRLLGDGVLGSEGDFHDRHHRLLEPLLHGAAIDRYAQVITAWGERMQASWRDGQVVNVSEVLAEATLRTMVEVLAGVGADSGAGREVAEALSGAVDALEHLPPPVGDWVDRLPLPAVRRFAQARARLDGLILPMVRGRRGLAANDLLGAIANAAEAAGEWDDRAVRDEALSIFRGHMTTGTALSWTWYLLSRHPGVETRVFEELDAVLGGETPDASHLARLTYCRAVLDESMRLFPPAWMLGRRALADHSFGRFVVPVGTTVVTSPYVIHRDARWHPDPRRFDPDRFAPERRAAWEAFAYFPFGGGPKRCLGDEFAPFEALLLLASVGRRWRLRPVEGPWVRPAVKATLRPAGGLRLRLERRAEPSARRRRPARTSSPGTPGRSTSPAGPTRGRRRIGAPRPREGPP
jgi:cytochrome P450